jgi:NAD+ kinase
MSQPNKAVFFKRWKDLKSTNLLKEMTDYFQNRGVIAYVEKSVSENEFEDLQPLDESKISEYDFIVCIGGDGTILHANTYFQNHEPIPPTICFGSGTLGFLTPFDPNNYQSIFEEILSDVNNPVGVTLRWRLSCKVFSFAEQKYVYEYQVLFFQILLISSAIKGDVD